MKKKLISMLVFMAVLVNAIGLVTASAAVNAIDFTNETTYTYTPGTVQDFSWDISGTGQNVRKVTEKGYGNLIEIINSVSYKMNFTEPKGGAGKYLLSFDMKLPKDDGNNRLSIYLDSNTTTDAQNFAEQFLCMTYAGSFLEQVDGNVFYGDNFNLWDSAWTHVDMIFVFDDDPGQRFVHVYTKGGSGSDRLRIEKDGITLRDINQIKGIKFQFNDYFPADNDTARLDNIYFAPLDEGDTVQDGTIKRVGATKIELGFLSTLDITKNLENSLTLTRTSLDGTVMDEAVEFHQDSLNENAATAVIEVPDLKPGYKYKVTQKERSSSGLVTIFPELIIKDQKIVNKLWDFEDDAAAVDRESGSVAAYGGKMKMIKYTDDEPWTVFNLDEEATGGEYIFSYDLNFVQNQTGAVFNIASGDTGTSNFQEWIASDGIRRKIENGSNSLYPFTSSNNNLGIGYVMDTDWYRVDNVLHIEEGYADMYYNGIHIGTQPLWKSQSAETPTDPIEIFSGALMLSMSGVNMDNVRIKNTTDTYKATVTANNDILFVDFDETTYGLTADKMTVKMTPKGATEAQDVPYTLEYQNATRAALKLNSSVAAGAVYTVTFKNVESFLGTPIERTASYKAPSMEDNVRFFDAVGNEYGRDKISPMTNTLKIYFKNGLDTEMSSLVYSLVSGNDTVNLSESYDSETNMLTLTADNVLGANKTYKFTLSGASDAEFTYYDDIDMTFTTAEGEFTIQKPVVTKENGKVNVSVNYTNSDADVQCKVICAGYSGDLLVNVEIKDLSMPQNTAGDKTFVFDEPEQYDRIAVYVWDSLIAMNPKTEAVEIQ